MEISDLFINCHFITTKPPYKFYLGIKSGLDSIIFGIS